ncbi:MAG: OmpA family protein [Planctomycetota bacterium]
MKKFLGWKTALAVLGLILFAQGCASTDTVGIQRYDEVRAKHARLLDENQRLDERIANLHSVIEALNKEIERLGPMHEEVKGLEASRNALTVQVKKLEAQLAERDRKLEEMRVALEQLTGRKWTVFAGGLRVPIQGDILFDSGKANLKNAGKLPLQNLQESVNKVLEQHGVGIDYIRIDGHTDTDPIKHSGFGDNWLLGAARANTVRKYMTELGGWSAYNMYVTSFAYTVPVAEGNTKEAKAKNRRVEVYIVPAAGK